MYICLGWQLCARRPGQLEIVSVLIRRILRILVILFSQHVFLCGIGQAFTQVSSRR
jgi:hypothetical protein